MVNEAVGEAVAAARDLARQVRSGTLRLRRRASTPFGIFTNDDLFKQARAEDPADVLAAPRRLPEGEGRRNGRRAPRRRDARRGVEYLITDLAVATVYGKDKHWAGELRAGKVTFDGTPGWHQALQEFIDMNNAGCFQPGATGTTHDLGGRAVRAGTGPDAPRPDDGKGRDRRREPAVQRTPTIRSRAGPARTRRRPSSTSASR